MRLLYALSLLMISAAPLSAQEDAPSPLVVPFAQFPPFLFLDEDGERTGFIVDLAEMLGSEIDVPIEYLDVPNAREWVAAQASGACQLLPGVLNLPPLRATSLFSREVAADVLRPAVLANNAELIASGSLNGNRVAVVPPSIGSADPILDQNISVEYASPQEAVIALLAAKVDAVLLPPPVVYGIALEAGFDGRIAFIGDPLQSATRHIALHESRAALMPAINAAIARMEADGRLEALRQRYVINVPPPPPEVLQIGVARLPPLTTIDDDGRLSGFTIDVTRAVAERANLQINFVPLPITEWVKGPTATGLDAIAALVVTNERRAFMDFPYPILERNVAVTVNADETRSAQSYADLAGRRVGVIAGSVFEQLLDDQETFEVIGYDTYNELFAALLAQKIDAVVSAPDVAAREIEKLGAKDRLRIDVLPDETIDTAIALRPGLGSVRERLNAVLPGYLLSDEYAAVREKYYGVPVFWTRSRVIWSLIAAGSAVLLIVVALVASTVRTRLLAANAVLSVRRELEVIFNAATSGIIALSADGRIVRINDRARHFLGGRTEEPPFKWPETIQFLEAETGQPLDESADPVRRVLSGHKLSHQTHLMRRVQAGDDPRFVRLDSASLQDEESGVHTVLVIDDVSAEERNRQVIERKSRLDALGQLTGGIAHDFNNLLASQLYAVTLARDAASDERRQHYLGVAESSINRGRSLTSRLLSFARKQPGLSSARGTAAVLDDFDKLVRPMIEAQIDLKIEVEEEEISHFCDQTQLETALMNLVLNSRDAILRSGEGNRIEIKARTVRAPNAELEARQSRAPSDALSDDGSSFRYVEISVSDNGPGMDKETLARCTDPFFTTKDSNSGTGLGLAMVFGFVRQSDADLRIYSELGVGTTVQLTLPRGAPDGSREERVVPQIVEQGEGQTVLVVEDEPQLLTMLIDTLESMGYAVISANSGANAMRRVDAGDRFDVLITDVVMPGAIGGFELARRIRAARPEIPVIYSSGYTGFAASEMGEVQAPLLQKPVSPADLAEALSQVLFERRTSTRC